MCTKFRFQLQKQKKKKNKLIKHLQAYRKFFLKQNFTFFFFFILKNLNFNYYIFLVYQFFLYTQKTIRKKKQ